MVIQLAVDRRSAGDRPRHQSGPSSGDGAGALRPGVRRLPASGAIWIDGDSDHARTLAQSLVAELVLQPLNHYLSITTVGDLQAPGIVEQGITYVDRLDEETVRLVERLASETGSLLADQQVTNTARARLGGVARDGLFVTAIAAGPGADPVLMSRLARAAMPGGRGIAVVALDPLDPPAIQLVIDRDGTLDVPHLGIKVRAARLDSDQLERVGDLLRREQEIARPDPDRPPPERPVLVDTDVEPYSEPTWDHCVRVFADVRVEKSDGSELSLRPDENPDISTRNAQRGPELIAYLALRSDRAATLHEIAEHLWWRKPIGDRTIYNILSGTRQALGGPSHLSLNRPESDHRYKLALTVVTDFDLLSRALEYARAAAHPAPHHAITALQPHLARIKAPPFRDDHLGSGLAEWAAAYRVVDRIEETVIEAALLAAELHADRGPEGIEHARRAIDQGLTACPTHEILVRAAMEVEAHAGNTEAVERRYRTLASRLIRDDLQPEEETTDLHRQLTNHRHQIG